ncbi:unnamed protein product [Rhodiola kirilowii]
MEWCRLIGRLRHLGCQQQSSQQDLMAASFSDEFFQSRNSKWDNPIEEHCFKAIEK